MSDHGLWRLEKEREKQRRGLTGRGIVGCITFILSLVLGGVLYWWLDNNYDLYAKFSIPAEWPGWLVVVLGVALLVLAIQVTLTVCASVIWRLTGRDKKVDDMMDDLLKQWDE
jgi:hypothetical protein